MVIAAAVMTASPTDVGTGVSTGFATIANNGQAPKEVLYAPQTSRHGPNYEYVLFWPHTAKNHRQFLLLLFCTGDGIFTVSIICIFCLILYRVLGSPLQSHEEDKRIEREDMWMKHHARFDVQREDGRMAATGAVYVPDKGNNTWANDERRKVSVEKIPVETISIKLSADDTDTKEDNGSHVVKVTVAGERKGSTLSVITHHDICGNFRHGLLPFSVDVLTELQTDRIIAKKKTRDEHSSAQIKPMTSLGNLGIGAHGRHKKVCFYHISAPGHVEGDSEMNFDEALGHGTWSMDALAGRLNKIVSCLGISGRCVYLGEGAGANICVRAAAETSLRANSSTYRILASSCTVAGLVLISAECGGPSIGNSLTSTVASAMLRTNNAYLNSFALGLFGTPSEMAKKFRNRSSGIIEGMNLSCVASFAKAYYTVSLRNRLRRRSKRMVALHNVPNLVLCAEASFDAKEKAEQVAEILDPILGSGVIAVETGGDVTIRSRFVVGSGALLSDAMGRKFCVGATKLFLESL